MLSDVCLVMSVYILAFRAVFLRRHLPHFLSVVLVFELITLGIYMLRAYCFRFSTNSFGCYVCFTVLVFSVAEAVLGLALLVRCSRGTGLSAVKIYSFIGV